MLNQNVTNIQLGVSFTCGLRKLREDNGLLNEIASQIRETIVQYIIATLESKLIDNKDEARPEMNIDIVQRDIMKENEGYFVY